MKNEHGATHASLALNLAEPEEETDAADKKDKKEKKGDEKKQEKAKAKISPPTFVGAPAIRSQPDHSVILEVRARSEAAVTAAWWHGRPVTADRRLVVGQTERAGIHTLTLHIRVGWRTMRVGWSTARVGWSTVRQGRGEEAVLG